jgi:hypothetical protein
MDSNRGGKTLGVGTTVSFDEPRDAVARPGEGD